MTPSQHCESKVYIRGTSLFYTLLFTPEPQRQTLIALFALVKELEGVLIQCSDPAVARIKLAWWKNEINHYWHTQQATHPILQAMQQSPLNLHQYEWLREQILNITDAILADLSQSRYLDWTGLQSYLTLMGASCARASFGILLGGNAPTPEQQEAADRLGQGLLFASLIRDIGLSAQQGRIYIPMEDLRQFNVTASQITTLKYSEEFKNLVRFEIERCVELLTLPTSLVKALRPHKKQLKPAFIMQAHCVALLKKLKQKPEQILLFRFSINPLHKFWIAYKNNLLK